MKPARARWVRVVGGEYACRQIGAVAQRSAGPVVLASFAQSALCLGHGLDCPHWIDDPSSYDEVTARASPFACRNPTEPTVNR